MAEVRVSMTLLEWIAIFSAAFCGTVTGGLIVALVVAGYIGAGFRMQPPTAPPRA